MFYRRLIENLLDIFVKTFSPGKKDNDLPPSSITVLCKRNEFKLSFQTKKEQKFREDLKFRVFMLFPIAYFSVSFS